MNTLNILTERNRQFAANFVPQPLGMPILKAMIVSCVDMRVDPAYILGVDLNEALVIRNIGGRITPATLETISLLQAISQVQASQQTAPPTTLAGRFSLIVLHHTDCGITRLVGKPDLLAPYFGIDLAELLDKHVTDPYAAVTGDVALLRAMSLISRGWDVSGLVYDVKTGLVETVVAPDPM